MQRTLLEGLWMSRMSAISVLFIGPDSKDQRPLKKYLELFGGFQHVFCFPISVYLFMLFLLNGILLPVPSLPVDSLHILQGLTHMVPPAGALKQTWARRRASQVGEIEWDMAQRQMCKGEGTLGRTRCPMGWSLRVECGSDVWQRIRQLRARIWEPLKAAQDILDL